MKNLIQRIKIWWRIKKSGGLPSTLDEAFARLDKLIPEDQRTAFKEMTVDSAMVTAHFGLGMWLRNNWKLWHGGPLTVWFKERGILHADDISGIVLKSYHHKLNGKPLGLDEQVRGYREHWEKMGIDPDTMKEKKCASSSPEAVIFSSTVPFSLD